MTENKPPCEHPGDKQEVDFSGVLVKVTCTLCGQVDLYD